ncbi:hypothetical protein [Actinacidiphila soli]|uniref:hypothetical protein n=1 Tax=Actinacidiphila soli TaxID=2487275 RepID=UPI000FCBC594|nr:hypothetical protein [Actinacidiphila soli]
MTVPLPQWAIARTRLAPVLALVLLVLAHLLLVPHTAGTGLVRESAPAFLAVAADGDGENGAVWGSSHLFLPDHDDHPPRKDPRPDVVAAAGVAAQLPPVAAPATIPDMAAPACSPGTPTILRC